MLRYKIVLGYSRISINLQIRISFWPTLSKLLQGQEQELVYKKNKYI